MKKSITIGVFILVLAFVGYTQAVPSGRPFLRLLALISALDTRVTDLEAAGGGSGGGGLFHAYIGGLAGGQITYVVERGDDVEVDASYPIPRTGKLVSLAVHPNLNELDGTSVFTVRVNGADTALQIDVLAGSTDVETIATDVNVGAGDLVALEVDTTLATVGNVGFLATFEYVVD